MVFSSISNSSDVRSIYLSAHLQRNVLIQQGMYDLMFFFICTRNPLFPANFCDVFNHDVVDRKKYWEACTAVHQMQSKWLDVGMEISAFHLQSKQYDSIRPPPLGRETKETNVLTRERMSAISPSELQEAIQNREVTDENLGDIGGSRRNFMNSPSGVMKSFRVSKNRQLITNEASGVFQAQESIPNDVKIIPSFFLQEATHLLSLLSAVAFSTLRSDIEGVETPLTTFLEGNPWPPVDPDCMDTKSLDLKHGEGTDAMMGLFSFLLGKGRSPAQRTM